jgi:NitT/TauT family transport system permease protein
METLLYSLGAARWQVFGKVVVPAVLPWMLGSLRINISLALAGAIVGEFIASGHGLGRMVIYAGTILDTTLVWVGVIVLSLLAMVMYFAVVELSMQLLGKGLQKLKPRKLLILPLNVDVNILL